MADFEFEVVGKANLSQVEAELSKLQNKAIELKNIKLSNSDFASQIQAELDKHQFSIKIANVNMGNAASQMRNVSNQIESSFQGALNKIGLVNGGIGNLEKTLKGAGFTDGSIGTVTQDLNRMSIEVNKITTSMQKNGNIKLNIQGTDSLERAVTIVRTFDKASGIADFSKEHKRGEGISKQS